MHMMGPVTELDQRVVAEAIELDRTPDDPLRAVAAAHGAGVILLAGEPEAFAAIVARLGAEAPCRLTGEAEPLARLTALVVADAVHRGLRRLLWVGARPRAVDRACGRTGLPLHEVRPERGAYTGEGLFWVPSIPGAPPGLGRAEPFDRVACASEAPRPPWTGPTLWLGPGGESVPAPAGPRSAQRTVPIPVTEPAEAVDRALRTSLLVLDPAPLGSLAQQAARGSGAARVATLHRLETRLGRMIRAHRAQRLDDGIETAHRLAEDRGDALDPEQLRAMKSALVAQASRRALEAEREQLATLRQALQDDGTLDELVELARQGAPALAVVASRSVEEAVRQRLGPDAASATDSPTDLEERLARARERSLVAVARDGELLEARVDSVALAGLRTYRLDDGGPFRAEVVVSDRVRVATEEAQRAVSEALPDERAIWERWCLALDLDEAPSHPRARARIEAALGTPTRVTIARLCTASGARLLLVGEADAPPGTRIHPTMPQARFDEALALLPSSTAILEHQIGRARDERAAARAQLERRRTSAEDHVGEARRRLERALGPADREKATGSLAEAEALLVALAEEAETLERAFEAARRSALARFATPPAFELRHCPSTADRTLPA